MKKGTAIVLSVLTLGLAHSLVKKAEAEKQEKESRKNIPCDFDNGISYKEFKQIVFDNAKRIGRIKYWEVSGPIVKCTVESNTGISDWNFEIDYNDYGEISGDYWIWTQNDDSAIPRKLADDIRYDLRNELDAIDYIPKSKIKTQNKSETNKSNLKWIITLLVITILSLLVLAAYPHISKFFNYLIHEDDNKPQCVVRMSSDDMIGQDYKIIGRLFENSGFQNIKYEKHDDVIFGFKHDVGEVESVSIGGKFSFSEGELFPYDSTVRIKYHTKVGDK